MISARKRTGRHDLNVGRDPQSAPKRTLDGVDVTICFHDLSRRSASMAAPDGSPAYLCRLWDVKALLVVRGETADVAGGRGRVEW